MLGNNGGFLDYIDLLLFRLAKLRRRPIAHDSKLEDFYEDFFTDNDDKVFNSGRDLRKVYKGQLLARIVRTRVSKGGRVIDVGCGVGDNLAAVQTSDISFAGLEFSARTLARARRVLANQVELQQGSAVRMPYEPNSADLMLCIEVLEHIPDQYQALREMYRVLKPDGVLVLSVPYRRWFPSYYTFMGHIRHYTRSELQKLLEESGFEAEEWLPNYPRWHRLANYCYMGCRVAAIALSAMGKRVDPHQVKLPFSTKPLLDFCFEKLHRIKIEEENINYSLYETSTFVLCKKRRLVNA